MKTNKKELASKLSGVLFEELNDKILNKNTKKSIQKSAKKIAKKVVKAERKTISLKKKTEKKAEKEQQILAKKQDRLLHPRIVKDIVSDEINIVNRSVENKSVLKNQPVDHQV